MQQYSNEESSEEHTEGDGSDNESTRTECGVCGKTFATMFNLKRHLTQHGSKDFKCNVCSKEFHNKYTFKEHQKTHIMGKNMCSMCGKCFSKPFWLNRHEQVFHGKQCSYQCQACGKPCSDKTVLEAHAIKHKSMETPYICETCGNKFMYKTTLRRHERRCDPNNNVTKGTETCVTCQKVFKAARLLKQHMRVHAPPKYTCHVCGRSFRWKNCLAVHHKSCVVEENTDNKHV